MHIFLRNKPFWFNINYTVTSTSKSKQKMKWFLSKAECRKNSKKHLGIAKGIAVQVACKNSVKMSKSTMYALVNSFEKNGYALTETKQGRHEHKWLVNNEIWAMKCKNLIEKKHA